MRKERYRRYLIRLFFGSVIFTAFFSWWYLAERTGVEASSGQSVSAAVGLPNRVYAGGMPVGIYLETDGVLVVGTGSVMDISGEERTPSGGCLQPGDYILAVNGHSVTDKEEIVQMVKENECQPVALTMRRGEKREKVEVEPVQTAEMEYRLGLWIRDDTQGIGTVTYITENGQFAALGHGISDPDTGKRIESTGGDLYLAQIHSIVRGTARQPGSLCGSIPYQSREPVGEISANCASGIYGRIEEDQKGTFFAQKSVEVAAADEVHTGEAVIRSAVTGECRDYSIQILELDPENENSKNLVLEVTDPELIELTGGIVQGMSGSPLLQDGKIIGAVTHVFVNDSEKGYGIFIENMMAQNQG